jgi:hypothetical protein
MIETNYREALSDAHDEFTHLLAQKKAVDERLVALSKTITSLRNLLNGKTKGGNVMKITEACRYVLHGARTPKTPGDIRKDLDGIGFPTYQYRNSLASIHTIMKRLHASGEVESVTMDGKTAYKATSKLKAASGLELYW